MYMRERFHDVLPSMPDAVSFDVTQAAQWFLRDDEKDYFDLKEVGPIVPPYQSMWMEFFMPSQIKSIDGGVRDTPHEWRGGGCVITARELPRDVAPHIVGNHYRFLGDYLDRALNRKDTRRMYPEREDSDIVPRWVIDWVTFVHWKRGGVQPVNFGAMTLDDKGRYIRHAEIPFMANVMRAMMGMSMDEANEDVNSWQADFKEQFFNETCAMKSPFMFCLALLNCRNVKTVDVPPQPAPILKQRAKKGIPYIQYKTLEVTPLRTVSQGGQRKDGTPEPKALHFVRGHFKDFSDKGLFGKFKGVYWWSSQVRGDVSKGIIDKDYRVSHD